MILIIQQSRTGQGSRSHIIEGLKLFRIASRSLVVAMTQQQPLNMH
jgi:hypothetical protein